MLRLLAELVALLPAAAQTTTGPVSIPLNVPFLGVAVVSNFGDYLIRIYQLAGMLLISASVIMIMWGGIIWITSADSGRVKQAKSYITMAITGVAFYLLSYTIVFIIVPTALDLRENKFVSGLVRANLLPTSQPGTPLIGGACQDPEALKARLAAGNPICGDTCPYTNCIERMLASYGSIIDRYFPEQRRLVATIICRESNGDPNVRSFDGGCGLMQITDSRTKATCPPEIMSPDANIQEGVALVKRKLSAVAGKSYGGDITKEQMAFAAYNCCANGDNPNDQSRSCSVADGWPALPKWACPIDPGVGAFNMCDVKDYACKVSACL